MSDGRKRRLSGCPIDYALDLFGDRWTLLVIRDLLFARQAPFQGIDGVAGTHRVEHPDRPAQEA